ncbi:hypothetical protein FRB94_003896 [Tulasnella sp. JGI-2019a]|nr:hypothetical protein FRB94_003896 [Tulasnella sp. JGI-2019a]
MSPDNDLHEPKTTANTRTIRRRLYSLSQTGVGADNPNDGNGPKQQYDQSSSWLHAVTTESTLETPVFPKETVLLDNDESRRRQPAADALESAMSTSTPTSTTDSLGSIILDSSNRPVVPTSDPSDNESHSPRTPRPQPDQPPRVNEINTGTAPDPDVKQHSPELPGAPPLAPDAAQPHGSGGGGVEEEPAMVEERQCRICLGGDEEQAELGRLFRPCKCRGSMKYVHVSCLNEWRKASQSSRSYWACDQCKYKYSLARTNAVLVTSPVVLGFTTTFLLTSLIFLSSFLVSYFVPDLDPSASASHFNRVTTRASTESTLEYYWGASSAWNAASDIIGLAVHTLNDAVFYQDGYEDGFDNDGGPVRMYYDIWNKWTTPSTKSTKDNAKVRERAKTVEQHIKANARKQSALPHPDKNERLKEEAVALPHQMSLLYRLAQRFVVGLSFLGIVSFLNLLISLSMYAPAQLMRRGRGLLGGRRARGDRARTGGLDLGTALILVFVAIGIARAVYKIYQLNQFLAKILLARAETAILEVPDNDADEGAVRDRRWSASWKRPWTKVSSWARKVYNIVGDPLEPLHLKIARYFAQSVSWGIRGAIRGAIRVWQDFGTVRDI